MSKTKKALSLFVSGLVLAFLGVGLVLINPQDRSKPAKAKSGEYETTWKAEMLMLVDRLLNQPRPNESYVNDEILVGVSKWKVTGGFQPTGPYFRELWDIPSCLPKFSFIPMPDGGYQRWDKDWGARITYKNFSESCKDETEASRKWLTGVVYTPNPNGDIDGRLIYPSGEFRSHESYSVSVTSTPPGHSELISTHPTNTIYKGNFNRGQAASCWKNVRNDSRYGVCFAATGPYAFRDWLNLPSNDSNNPRESTSSAGIMMPLEWKVKGYVCDNESDLDCK